MAFDEDPTIFFNLDEFGVNLTYTDENSVQTQFVGIFTRIEDDYDQGAATLSDIANVIAPLSVIPNPLRGTYITEDDSGLIWQVINILNRDTLTVELEVEKERRSTIMA